MGWKKYKLKELIENFSIRARDYGGSEGLEFLGVSNEDGITASKYAAEDKGEDYKIIEKGCFAYNPYRINVGSIGYLDNDIKGLISPAYVVFKSKPNSIHDVLLFKFLKSAEGLRQIKFQGRGTVRQALRFEDLCKIEISLPSFEEQSSLLANIVSAEKETLQLNTELSNQLSLVKQLRQAFLSEAMQGKLALAPSPLERAGGEEETGQQLLARVKAEKVQLIKDKKLKKEKELPPIKPEEIPFEIPDEWVWCRFQQLGKSRLGKMLDGAKNSGKLVDYLRNTNVQWHYFELEDIKQFKVEDKEVEELRLLKGDLLICEGGVPGRCAIWEGENTYMAFQKALHRFRTNGAVYTKLIEYYLTFSYSNGFLQQYFTGNQIKHLTGQSLEKLLFPLPPLSIQKQIVVKLDELMKTCDDLEASIKQSQIQNEQLLQQVLKEALEVKDSIN